MYFVQTVERWKKAIANYTND